MDFNNNAILEYNGYLIINPMEQFVLYKGKEIVLTNR